MLDVISLDRLQEKRCLMSISHVLDSPNRIIYDQGGESDSKMFKQVSELSGIANLCTIPCHPEDNEIV